MSEIEYVNLEKPSKPKQNQNRKQFNNNRPRQNRYQQDRRPRPAWKQRPQQRQQQPQSQFRQNRIRTGRQRRERPERPVSVERPREIVPRGPTPNVIIKGLDSKTTEVSLKELCQEFGAMDMCKLDRDNFGNIKPEGIGLITFVKFADAKACVEKLDGVTVAINGEENNQRVISAKLIDKKKNNNRQSSGVLQISRGPIQKNWKR